MTTVVTSTPIEALDWWIRGRFAELNTELEDRYFVQANRSSVSETGTEQKAALVEEGRQLIAAVLAQPLPDDADVAFAVLGDVGYYLAACRRHEITNPARERTSPLTEASVLALRLGTALGTAPRFMTSHMETHNRAIDGMYRTFTTYDAERVFLDGNTRSAFAYMRAADALQRALPLGVSHPVTADLLRDATRALTDALTLNIELAEHLDVDRFFFCVRPYYRPHRVGSEEFRGANAGDFAAFNEVDLLLGLCQMGDLTYSQLIAEKLPFLTPDDQTRLRRTVGQRSLLDLFVDHTHDANHTWFQHNATAFLQVCDVHGAVAAQHHDVLVEHFISRPADSIPPEHLEGITASGPPLDVLLRSLERLRDQRLGVPRDDIATRHRDLTMLRNLIVQ